MSREISFNLSNYINDSVNAPKQQEMPKGKSTKPSPKMDPSKANLDQVNSEVKKSSDSTNSSQDQSQKGAANLGKDASNKNLGDNVKDPTDTKIPKKSLDSETSSKIKAAQAKSDLDNGIDQSDTPNAGADEAVSSASDTAKQGFKDRIKSIIKKKAMAAISEQLNGPPEQETGPSSGPPHVNRPNQKQPNVKSPDGGSPKQDVQKPKGEASYTPPPARNIPRPPSINFKAPSIPKYKR